MIEPGDREEDPRRVDVPRMRTGRLRPRANQAPPLWFGVPFAIAGVVTLGLGISQGYLPLILFGLFFGAVGVGIILTSIRAEGARRPFRTAEGGGGVDVFTRSPMRVLMDLVLAPLGGIAFLGFALVWPAMGPIGIIGTVGFAFFGLVMLGGAAVTMRRGVRRAMAEVGPAGIWTPELGRRLAWSDIAELRIEDARGAGGGEGLPTVAVYRRLGVWPRDPALAARAPGRGLTGMVRGFTGFINSLQPSIRASDPAKMAPFGVQAFEIEQDFDELVRSIRRYAPVGGAALVPPTPALLAGLAAVLPGALAPSVAPSIDGEPGSGTTAGSPGPAAPETFGRRDGTGSIRWYVAGAQGPLFVVGIPLLFLGISLAAGIATAPLIAIPWFLIPVGFLLYGIGSLLELPGRWRLARGDNELVTVDDRGVTIRGLVRLAWSQIEDVRVKSSPQPVGEGEAAIRRLEIVPRDERLLEGRPWADRAFDRYRGLLRRLKPLGDRSPLPAAFGLDLDMVDDPERLLDTIARYRLVDETG